MSASGRTGSTRGWLAGGAVATLVLIAVSWFVFIGPRMQAANDFHDGAIATRADNDRLARQASALRAKRADLPSYTSKLRAALAALPYDSGLPAFTRQLAAQARAHHVDVDSVTVGGIVSADGASGAGTPAGRLYSLPVTVHSSGSAEDQIAFLEAVRADGPRRSLVTSTSLSAVDARGGSGAGKPVQVTTQLSVFSAPRSPQQVRQLSHLLDGDVTG